MREHFFRSELSEAADDMVTADWIDCLSDLPQEAVARAFRERLRSPDRRRPLPGEIRALAERHLERVRLATFKTQNEEASDEMPRPKVIPPEELARRREVAAEIQAMWPKLKRIPAWEGD